MSEVDSELFLARYPHFSGLSEEIIDSELLVIETLIPAQVWRDTTIRNHAIMLLTAHNLSIDYYEQLSLGNQLRLTEVGDEIKPKDLSKQSYYSLTPYGLQYQRLLNQFGLGIFVP